MDDDLASLTRDQLIAEMRRLRYGIRAHRDNSGHDLCWHLRYREPLDRQLPNAPRIGAEYDPGDR